LSHPSPHSHYLVIVSLHCLFPSIVFSLMLSRAPPPAPFPYTTLFRSNVRCSPKRRRISATCRCGTWARSAGRLRTPTRPRIIPRSEEHTSELQSPEHLVCPLLHEKKKKNQPAPKGASPKQLSRTRHKP